MSIDNMIFNDECLPAKTGKKRRMPLSPFSFNVVLEILTSTIKLVKEIKIAQIGKKEIKLSAFVDNMIIYI